MDDPDLNGKVAVITGASRGIGAATAARLAAAGASVALAARDESALGEVAERITAAGGTALAVPTDVADPAAVEALVERAVSELGGLDIAFNNAAAAGSRPTPLAELEPEAFAAAIAVSLTGVFLSMRSEIPAMLNRGGGAIVNMSSTAGFEGVSGLSPYVAAKHGVIGLTRTARARLRRRGDPRQRGRSRADPHRQPRAGRGGDAAARRAGDPDGSGRRGRRGRHYGPVAVLGGLLLRQRRHRADRRGQAGGHGRLLEAAQRRVVSRRRGSRSGAPAGRGPRPPGRPDRIRPPPRR